MSTINIENLSQKELRERYGDVLSTSIIVEPDPLPSFLEISGFPYYEEVISNLYAFFFDSEGPHGLKTLFIDTLTEMIMEILPSDNSPTFEKCKVIRERTVKGKSIDLLLYDEAFDSDGEECYRNAIVIENKIFASLYNELALYYKNISAEEYKSGVVLSIVPLTVPGNYANITHSKFLNRIFKNISGYLLRASDKYLVLLKDLFQQITLQQKPENMKEYVSFYFENAEKINELNKIRVKAVEALVTELKIYLENTPFRTGRKYPESVNMRCSLHDNILLILETDKIFDQAVYSIQFWVTYELAKIVGEQPTIISQLISEAVAPSGFVFNQKKTGGKYAWVGSQTVQFARDLSNLQQLPMKIAEDLSQSWKPFILKCIETLTHVQQISVI